jgi:hypothetical protein
LWKKGEASESWLEGADWVVDAIDNVPTKASLRMMHLFHLTNPLADYCKLEQVDLLAHCHKKNIKVRPTS